MRTHEKVLLYCMITILLFIGGVAVVMLLNDTVCSAKEERLETSTPPGMPSDLRYFNGKFYVRVDINDVILTTDDLGYFIEGAFYAPVGGFETKWVMWEKERIEKQKDDTTDQDETIDPDDMEEIDLDPDVEDEDEYGLYDWNMECPYCHKMTGTHCGCRYGTDFVI